MRIYRIPEESLELVGIDGPDVDLRRPHDELRLLVRSLEPAVTNMPAPNAEAARAVVGVLVRAVIGESFDDVTPASLIAIAAWMRNDLRGTITFWRVLFTTVPAAVNDVAMRLLAAEPTATADVACAAVICDGEVRASLTFGLARHPVEAIREHYFALLGQHRLLMPPGAISTKSFDEGVLRDVLRSGATDTSARVRVRAIAVAYGMNAVATIRDEVIAGTVDQDAEVRRYALVALGTLADAATLQCLRAKLVGGTQSEVKAAIWALSRRPDGLADALALAGDSRSWVQDELVDAIANNAAALTEAQVAAVRSASQHAELPAALEAHRRRWAAGGRQEQTDGQWLVVRSPGAKPLP